MIIFIVVQGKCSFKIVFLTAKAIRRLFKWRINISMIESLLRWCIDRFGGMALSKYIIIQNKHTRYIYKIYCITLLIFLINLNTSLKFNWTIAKIFKLEYNKSKRFIIIKIPQFTSFIIKFLEGGMYKEFYFFARCV